MHLQSNARILRSTLKQVSVLIHHQVHDSWVYRDVVGHGRTRAEEFAWLRKDRESGC